MVLYLEGFSLVNRAQGVLMPWGPMGIATQHINSILVVHVLFLLQFIFDCIYSYLQWAKLLCARNPGPFSEYGICMLNFTFWLLTLPLVSFVLISCSVDILLLVCVSAILTLKKKFLGGAKNRYNWLRIRISKHLKDTTSYSFKALVKDCTWFILYRISWSVNWNKMKATAKPDSLSPAFS